MRVPDVLSPMLAQSLLAAIGQVGTADLYAYLSETHTGLTAALNGNLELGENLAVAISGTFDVAAHTTKDFGHTLGRVPKWCWAMPKDTDISGYASFPMIYWAATDKDASWSTTNIRLRCFVATNVTTLTWEGWLI